MLCQWFVHGTYANNLNRIHCRHFRTRCPEWWCNSAASATGYSISSCLPTNYLQAGVITSKTWCTYLELNVPAPSSYMFRRSPICYSRVRRTSELPAEPEMPRNHSVPKACTHFLFFSSLGRHLQLLVHWTFTTFTKHNQQSQFLTRKSIMATFIAVADPAMRISFLLARCRYLSHFLILLVNN